MTFISCPAFPFHERNKCLIKHYFIRPFLDDDDDDDGDNNNNNLSDFVEIIYILTSMYIISMSHL